MSHQIETVQSIAADNEGGEFQFAVKPEERSVLWAARHSAYYANIALRPGCRQGGIYFRFLHVMQPFLSYRALTTDVCVPISALPQILTITKQDITDHGLTGPIVGHVGDGNFHSMLLFDNEEEYKTCKSVANRIATRAIELGGEMKI